MHFILTGKEFTRITLLTIYAMPIQFLRNCCILHFPFRSGNANAKQYVMAKIYNLIGRVSYAYEALVQLHVKQVTRLSPTGVRRWLRETTYPYCAYLVGKSSLKALFWLPVLKKCWPMGTAPLLMPHNLDERSSLKFHFSSFKA